MTSPTKLVGRAQTERLLKWMKQEQPRAYAGLVRRFTPKGELSGLLDSITGIAGRVVDSVTNFVNSQGAQSLLTAASPFLQTQLEKKQLELNIKRMQAGMLPQQYTPSYAPGVYPGSMLPDSMLPQPKPIPWGWITGGALGIGALLMATRRR